MSQGSRAVLGGAEGEISSVNLPLKNQGVFLLLKEVTLCLLFHSSTAFTVMQFCIPFFYLFELATGFV
jgi:hypothetical protein